MYAYDYEPPRGDGSKAVWIVDDDRSIRWVLEKALAREGIPFKTFATAYEVLQALGVSQPQVLVSDIRMPGESGLALLNKVKERLSADPGHHHDRVLGPRQRRRGVPGRRVRISAQAVRRRPRAGADPPRDERNAGDRAGAGGGVGDARDPGPGAGDAGGVPRHRPPVAIERDGADHRRVGHRQGTRRARAAPAQPARGGCRSSRSTRRRSRRTCSSRSSSATSAARSPARRRCAAGASSRPKAARCSWTRSATCRPTCRCACCACWPTASTTASAATRRCAANVRIIAATHQNLEERVRQGLFREDLMHRLNVVRLRLPPLRERPDDIAPLARHFLQKSARDLAVEPKALSDGRAEGAGGSLHFPATCASSRTSATG